MPDSRALESALAIARERSARGNATRQDWLNVARLDESAARRELFRFLRASEASARPGPDPYARGNHGYGIAIGFALGCLVMMVSWAIFPWLRDVTKDNPTLHDIATFTQFLSTLFVPIGAWLGGRWSANRQRASVPATQDELHITPGADLDNMLRAFETTQHVR